MPSYLDVAKATLKIEAESILNLIPRLGADFEKAVQMILDCQGKIVFTGIGKSGHISRKLSSTFSSTGTPAVYLHPAESSHGDLGVVTKNDLVVAISYGGEAAELNSILNFSSRYGIPVVGLTGKIKSTL